MTKHSMTKKFMRETGADKKTAMEYLRKCQWNYRQAKLLWYTPEALSNLVDIAKEIDWASYFTSIVKAVEDAVKIITEVMQKADWNEVVKKLKEERGDKNG